MTSISTRKSPFVLVLAGCLAFALVDGCTCSEEPQAPTQATKATPPPPRPAPKPVERRPIPKTLKEQLEKKVALVDNYPADAPVYPGANLSSSLNQHGRATAVFSTSDSAGDVSAWAADYAEAQGWDVMPEIQLEKGILLQALKGRRQLSIVVSAVDETADMTMMVVSVTP